VNKEEFFDHVDQGITVVDFFADWCAPCKGQTVVFNYLKKNSNFEDVQFLKFDVDNDDREVSNDFEIESIPTLIIFKDGQEEFRFVGVTGADMLTKAIKKVQS
jgi:thioredoxin 1